MRPLRPLAAEETSMWGISMWSRRLEPMRGMGELKGIGGGGADGYWWWGAEGYRRFGPAYPCFYYSHWPI
jgi:hypothetical protein